MLGKCFKYEFKSFSRLLVPMMIACCASNLVLYLFMQVSIDKDGLFGLFASVGLMPIMFVSGIGSVVICFIQAPRRFYSAMLSKESYLIRTLPVSTHIYMFAIMLNSLLWFLVCLNFTLLSFYSPAFDSRASFTYVVDGISEFWQELFSFKSGFNIIHLLTLYLFGQIVIMIGITVGSIVGKGSKAYIALFIYLSYKLFSFIGSVFMVIYFEISDLDDLDQRSPLNKFCIYGAVIVISGFVAIVQLIRKKADVY